MYLIAQIWWLLLIAFYIGALGGYLVWRACSRPRLESQFTSERLELQNQIERQEHELIALRATSQRYDVIDTSPALSAADVAIATVAANPIAIDATGNGVATADRSAVSPQPEPVPIATEAPAGGKKTADNLKLIRGIGPRLEKILNGMGVYRFDQIANWTTDDITAIDRQLGDFSGRALRDKWIEQSRHLLAGGTSPKSGKYTQ